MATQTQVQPETARQRKAKRTHQVIADYSDLWAPPSEMPLSEWADNYRVLSSESSAEPGQWVTAKAPYEKAIMDAISDPHTPRICVQKASQLGITDSAILNPIGYFMDQEPCPILVVQPTIEIGEAFSTDRLAPMLRDSPRLRDKVSDTRSRDASNTLRRKSFKGGYVAIGGANSAASLSGRPVRVVLLDEVDRYPASAGTEGNPLQLAIARTTAFWNRKVVMISSPGLAGISHIEREMAESTQEHWYLPCPMCEHMQVLDWDRIRFSDLTHECSECHSFSEKWRWLTGEGEWRAHRPIDKFGNKVTTRGFYLSGLYNPWVEWDVLRDEFIRAAASAKEGDIEPMKAFRNTRLGLLHEDTGQSIDIDLYSHRREIYQAEVPEGVLVLTAGVDVGERQLNYEIVGWGRGKESWGIEYGWIDGDPREQEVWDLLDKAVYRRILTTHDNRKMRVRRMAVDANYASDYVYAYTKPRQPRALAVRGEGGLGKPLIKGTGTLAKTNRAHIVTLGVDTGKEEIVTRLLVATPGPGFCHFPMSEQTSRHDDGLVKHNPVRGYDDEYFKGLTAEKRIVKSKHGFRTYIWTKRLSQRNEPFDVRNYALAALSLPWANIKLNEMERDLLEASGGPVKSNFGARSAITPDLRSTGGPPPAGSGGSKFGATTRPVE